jgi:uncharacterized membrane protein (UPF0127 family)
VRLPASKTIRVVVAGREAPTLCERCRVASSFAPRLKGLLGRKSIAGDEGLLVSPAPAVHTLFMRFAIDVVFIDRDLAVIGVSHNLRPWRAAAKRGAAAVLELKAGELARRGVQVGDHLAFDDAEGGSRGA